MAAQLEEAAGNSSRAADLFVRKNLSDRAAARRRRRLFESKKEMKQAGREEGREGRRRRNGRKQVRSSSDSYLTGGLDYAEGGLGGDRGRLVASDSEVIERRKVDTCDREAREDGRRTLRAMVPEDSNPVSVDLSSAGRTEEINTGMVRGWRTLA